MEDFKTVNVETIGDKCIEIHFRDSPTPIVMSSFRSGQTQSKNC